MSSENLKDYPKGSTMQLSQSKVEEKLDSEEASLYIVTGNTRLTRGDQRVLNDKRRKLLWLDG